MSFSCLFPLELGSVSFVGVGLRFEAALIWTTMLIGRYLRNNRWIARSMIPWSAKKTLSTS